MATKLGEAYVNIVARAENLQRDMQKQLNGLGKISQNVGRDMGRQLEKGFSGSTGGLDSDVKSGLSGMDKTGKQAGQELGDSMSKEIEESINDTDFEGMGQRISGMIGKGLAAAGGIAGVAGVGMFAGLGKELSAEITQVNNEMGYAGAAAEQVGEDIRVALKSGVASGAADAAGAIGALEGQFKYLGSEGEQTAGQLSDNFMAFSRTFDVDIAEATQMAGQLIQNDFAPDVESAADLMTTAMQRVPQAMRGEVQDAINEYGTNFKNLGFTGEEAFSLIIGAADQGQYAIDKTGDAIKEYSVLAVDPAKAEAFETLGMNAEQAASAVAEGGEGARKTLEETAQRLLDMEDPGKRAATAIELFGAPIEDLGVDKIPAFLENLTGVENGMSGAAGASQELADTMSESLGGRLDKLKGTVQSLAGDAFMALWDTLQNKIIPAFQDVGDWIQRNETWLGPLVSAVSGAALAWGAWTLAVKGWQAATKIATGVQAAFNAVMAANPIMLVVIAITALVAGLVYFFTQTELGQELWAKFTDALAAGWDWVVEKLSAGWDWIRENVFTPLTNWAQETLLPILSTVWEGIKAGWDGLVTGLQWAYDNIISPVFNAFVTVGKWLFAILTTVVLTPLLIAWNALSSGISWAWENIIKPAWEALQSAATWMWESVLSPVFTWIGEKWQQLTTAIKWYWENVTKPAWNALQTAATWMWENVLLPVFGFIQDRWKQLSDALKWAWENIIKPAWDALGNALTWLYENIIQPTLQWISDRWDDMSNALEAGWNWINDHVFTPLGDGLETVQGWFETAVRVIRDEWESLKEKLATPINFVIDTVFNNGIRPAWNAVAGLVNLPELDEVPMIGGYAQGGVLPGYTPGRDVHDFYSPTGGRLALSGGEAIMRPEWTRAVGGPAAVDQMNRAARSGSLPVDKHDRRSAAHAAGGVLDFGAFANGGVIDAMINIVSQKYPQLTMTSGLRPGHSGYHGMGLATDWSNGSGNTPAQLALAHDIAATYPGSAQLIYDSPGWAGNIWEGQPAGAMNSGVYTTAEAGRHDHHVHWAMTTPPTMPFGGGVFEGGSDGGGGGGFWQSITGTVKKLWDAVIDKIPGYGGSDSEGLVGRLPGSWLSTVAGAAWDHIKSLADNIKEWVGGGSSGSVDVDGITGPVVDQVEEVFARHGFTGAEWDAAKWIIQKESSWDPSATNPSSGAFGLFQFNPMGGDTLGTYLPSRSTDPAVQGDAGARYIKDRYGTPTAAKAFWEQNGWYDEGGVLPTGTTLVQNDTGQPEAILNPAQWRMFNRMVTNMPFLTESMEMVAKEIGGAFLGNDFGYGELARVLRNEEWAQAIVSGSASLGTISREVGAAVAPVARESGEEYLETQATSALDIVGLGGLVPLGVKAGETAWEAYQASPVEVGFNGQRVVVEIDAEGGDFVHVDKFQELANQVHGLDVRVHRKAPAAMVTRGGPM